MFTGIIKNTGRFKAYALGKQKMTIQAPTVAPDIKIGGSLSVDGVCLSLVKKKKDMLTFDLSPETLTKTTLGSLRREDCLNLELPLTLQDPLSGHLVTGHIDDKGKVIKVESKKKGKRITLKFPPELRLYFIPKGSVAVNGVSLTIASIKNNHLDIEVIPITLEDTNLSDLKTGSEVNIECDIIGKYVYNYTVKSETKID
ncbi:MAG TPA: riboflavin synthase [Acidobacteriota bacterium]|nr:riboflavin synthase [Acidobacteriota bacterium]